jgi:hypothetical protein
LGYCIQSIIHFTEGGRVGAIAIIGVTISNQAIAIQAQLGKLGC